MTSPTAQQFGLGNEASYILGTLEGWPAFGVVRWHAVEEISRPFRYEITLLRDAKDGPVDPYGLLNSGATFRIRTLGRVRSIHGILTEAEEIDRTSHMILYHVVLVPPFYRACFRRRCRNFVDWTLKDILIAVLENRSPAYPNGHKGLHVESGPPAPLAPGPGFGSFDEPDELYRWAVADEARVTDATTSPYIAQYNESDFDFLSRLLEREGLGYYFDHTDDASVMVVTDNPMAGPIFAEATKIPLYSAGSGGTVTTAEVIRACRTGRRMRSSVVTMRDYDWNRSRTQFEAEWDSAKVADPDSDGHFEFPAGDELNKKDPGSFPARIRLERFTLESNLREGSGTARAMEPGRRFTLHDVTALRDDEALLIVRVEAFATELTPEGTVLDDEPFGFAGDTGPLRSGYVNHFQALPTKMQFRPAMIAPRPRIHGVQTAVVTAEEFPAGGRPEINADRYGCVRVRFPWDQRPEDDKTPSSSWIRVSQYWAGPGFGALYNPRVGHEVLVSYLQGDPERPVIVGRVYNEPNRPPYDPSQSPTKSTLKSQTAVPKGDGFNELRFEDASAKEEIFLHAQRDLNEVVLASHSTSVGGDQSNSVEGDRTHEVQGNESVTVHGDRTTTFEGNEAQTVHGNRTHKVHGNESVTVHGDRTTVFESSEGHTVYNARKTTIGGGGDFTTIAGTRTTLVGQNDILTVAGSRVVNVADETSIAAGQFYWTGKSATFSLGESFNVIVGGCTLTMTPGVIKLQVGGATINMQAGQIFINNAAGAYVALNGGAIMSHADGFMALGSDGAMFVEAGGPMYLVGADINAQGGTIKLND